MQWSVRKSGNGLGTSIATFDAPEQAWALAEKLKADGWTGISVYMVPDQCAHQKVYENKQLMSNPPQQRWICASCGEEGIDVVGTLNWNQYEAVRKQFGKGD